MGLSTESYDNLIALVQAQVGSVLVDSEKSRINALINLAGRRAYAASQWWERYLITGEPRTVTRGYVESTEDSFYVYGAGTGDVNGLYKRNGDSNAKPQYTKYDLDGTTALYNIQASVSDGSNWAFSSSAGSSQYTYSGTASDTPPLSGWTASNGTAPAPLLVDVAEIETFLRIYSEDPAKFGRSRQIPFVADSKGARLLTNEDVKIVYVDYKKTLSDVFGDGTGGTTADIPEEFFDYMSLYAARQYQISSRQGNDSPYATIASREVEEALQDALMKIEEQNYGNNYAKNVQTHLSQSPVLH